MMPVWELHAASLSSSSPPADTSSDSSLIAGLFASLSQYSHGCTASHARRSTREMVQQSCWADEVQCFRLHKRGGSFAAGAMLSAGSKHACSLQLVPESTSRRRHDAAELDVSKEELVGSGAEAYHDFVEGYMAGKVYINSPSRLQILRSMMFPALLHSFSQACYAWSTGALASQPRLERFLLAWHGASASLTTSLITCLHLTAGQVLRLVSISETHLLFTLRNHLEASRAPLTRPFPLHLSADVRSFRSRPPLVTRSFRYNTTATASQDRDLRSSSCFLLVR
jgi:hypothetical protein